MKLSVKMIIFSHLSDVQENSNNKYNNVKLNFVKFLLQRHPDTGVKVDADYEWETFMKEHPDQEQAVIRA